MKIWVFAIVLAAGTLRAATAGGADDRPIGFREAACSALELSAASCARDLDVMGAPPLAPRSLVLVRRYRVAEGEQIELRCSGSTSPPYLVLLRGHSDSRPPRAQKQFASTRPLVRAGETATLFQETSGVRLSRRVRCLENGRKNQWIRIRDVTSGEIFRGRVMGSVALVADY